MANTQLQGNDCHTNGDLPEIGSTAPDFQLVSNKLEDCSLANYKDNFKLLYVVPSLDTMVCAKTAKQLNELAEEYPNTSFLVISADLPFAQQRFCKQNKLKNIQTLSMMRSRNFAKDYGVLLIDSPLAGVTARAVFVLDANNNFLMSELMQDITHEPDFTKALSYLQV